MALLYSNKNTAKSKKNKISEDNLELLKDKRAKQKMLYPIYKKYCYLEKSIYEYLKNSFTEKNEKLKLSAAARLSMLKALILLRKEKEILGEKIDIREIRIKRNKKLKKKIEDKKNEAYKELYREVKNKMKLFSYTNLSSNNSLKESPKNISRAEKEKQDMKKELLRGVDLHYNESKDLLTSSDKNEILKLKEEHILASGTIVRIYNSLYISGACKNNINSQNGGDDNLENYKKNDDVIIFKSSGKLFKSTRRNVYYCDFIDSS